MKTINFLDVTLSNIFTDLKQTQRQIYNPIKHQNQNHFQKQSAT